MPRANRNSLYNLEQREFCLCADRRNPQFTRGVNDCTRLGATFNNSQLVLLHIATRVTFYIKRRRFALTTTGRFSILFYFLFFFFPCQKHYTRYIDEIYTRPYYTRRKQFARPLSVYCIGKYTAAAAVVFGKTCVRNRYIENTGSGLFKFCGAAAGIQ